MASILSGYLSSATGILNTIATEEQEALHNAAEIIANAYLQGRKIYIFGCTHSAILAEDVFYRAGAPAFWQPLWGPGMSIATTPGFLTSAVERSQEVGEAIIENSLIAENDVILVISTSGKNAAPVAVAEKALDRGAKVIIISSSFYRDAKGNHTKIASLWQLKNQALIIDNHVPCGDASINVGECPMGPVSTIAGSFILHSISALTIEKISAQGGTPPVFLSSNAPGGREHNEALLNLPGMREKFMLP